MSNYRYLREIIEKIAERGNVPKSYIPEATKWARSDPALVKAVDDYINKGKRAVRFNPKVDNLYDYLEQADADLVRNRYNTETVEDILEDRKNTYNKYAKYVQANKRPKIKQDILEQYMQFSDEDSDTYKKASELLEQLLLNKTT